jgi:hypothetical protein
VVPPCARDIRLEFEEAGLPIFNSPQANLGTTMAHLQQANPSPEAEAAMAYLRVAIAWVEEKNVTSKSAVSSSSRHSRCQSNRLAHSKLPTIRVEVDQNNPDQPRANGVRDVCVTLAATSTSAILSVRTRSCGIGGV